jgi:hypothetical protein
VLGHLQGSSPAVVSLAACCCLVTCIVMQQLRDVYCTSSSTYQYASEQLQGKEHPSSSSPAHHRYLHAVRDP